jgi:DNA topoisomerase I
MSARSSNGVATSTAGASRSQPLGRLRRSDPSKPGYGRRREAGRFAYLDLDGAPLTDAAALARIAALAIPPAWERVWICVDELGHLQATGIDSAGRKQYLYHQRWRERQDHRKFAHMERFARALPAMREQVLATMGSGKELSHERVLACAVRLLDIGLFRIGGEAYEQEDAHLGLATVAKTNVTVAATEVVFDYVGKAGVRHVQAVRDPPTVAIVSALARRRSGGEHLLAYRSRGSWHPVHSEHINVYLKTLIGADFSAKNFRTWNGTVLAAASLAAAGDRAGERARKRAMSEAARAVSQVLGNTPAVARRSYIDPRVFDRYLSGWTIAAELERIAALRESDDRRRAELERAVLDLLDDRRSSSLVEHIPATHDR